jgi:TolB-like protein/Tfp pilus assembly protein PilF
MAALLGILGTVIFRTSPARNATQPAIRSLAVLPLRNLSGDPTQEYLADGMTEALIGRLSSIHDLRVISRTSAMQFKETQLPVPEIAKTLQVDAIVEGSILREGDRIRVSAHLIRAATDEHIWSEAYDRKLQDVLSLQSEVAQSIARRVEVTISGEEHSRLSETRPVSPEVYETYLKGVFFQNKRTPDAVRTAIRYFQETVEKDPKFADAHAHLAYCYITLSYINEMFASEAHEAAKLAAQKAVDLNPNLDHAHTALAALAYVNWDWTRAETEYRRAIQLNPSSVDAHSGYFLLLLTLQKLVEAGEQEQEARAADPLSPDTLHMAVRGAYHRRQYDDGLIKARKAIELYPQVPVFHDLLSSFYAATGQDDLSAQEILLVEETSGADPERLAALRAAFAAAGPKGLRRKRIELDKKIAAARQSINSYEIAIDCALVGDRYEAIRWLEKAFRSHDPKICLISAEPIFDSLRTDPRFVDLLNQMGLRSTLV